MKKLLGIVVMGLLLSGNAYANKNENIKIDLIFCDNNNQSNKRVYLKDTFDGSCPPSQPIEISYKKFKKKYGWQFNKQLCYLPYEKKSERVILTPGGSCNGITRFIAIKIKHKGGNYYYSDKEREREIADKKKKPVAGSGTAFFIDNKGHLITNFHVVEKCYDQSKIIYKNNEYDTKLIAKDKFLDLALLKANVQNNKFIIISNKPPKKLKKIIVAGYPFGKDLSDDLKFNSGIITSLKGFKDDSTRIQIDAAVNFGNSGGPIVYEENGLLAAVAVAGLRKDMTEAINFGIKGSSLRNFLEANQLNLATIEQKFSFDDEDLAELLEATTLYTFCK